MRKILLVLTALACIACSKDDDTTPLWSVDVKLDDSNAIIKQSTEGIDFVFCLYNEQGIPTTTFKQGENFGFYFSVTNNTNEKLCFDPAFAYSLDIDFCRVYNLGGEDFGKPYENPISAHIGAGAYPFTSRQQYVFQTTWIDERDNWSWFYGAYKNAYKTFLPKGSYYTEFEYTFRFARTIDEPSLYVGPLKFRICFTIE